MKPKNAPPKMKNKTKLYPLVNPTGPYTLRAAVTKAFAGGRSVVILKVLVKVCLCCSDIKLNAVDKKEQQTEEFYTVIGPFIHISARSLVFFVCHQHCYSGI